MSAVRGLVLEKKRFGGGGGGRGGLRSWGGVACRLGSVVVVGRFVRREWTRAVELSRVGSSETGHLDRQTELVYTTML